MLSNTQVKLINELCDYVEKNVAPENFDLRGYRSVDYNPVAIQELTKENPDPNICGTAGCMIGHAPTCHPELHKGADSWDEVSVIYCEAYTPLWAFMFGPDWRGYQNTPKGSVERIRLALEFAAKGLTEDQWASLYRANRYGSSPTSTELLKNALEDVFNAK